MPFSAVARKKTGKRTLPNRMGMKQSHNHRVLICFNQIIILDIFDILLDK